jgi:hypothetical protein
LGLILLAAVVLYLGSFAALVRTYAGTKTLQGADVRGCYRPDGQFIPYDQYAIYISEDPEINRWAYYTYYPVHATAKCLGIATFIRDTSSVPFPGPHTVTRAVPMK